MKNTLTTAAVAATLITVPAMAHDGEYHGEGPRVDDHAPIGVMADHYHKKGEWMVSLRGMGMGMDDPANTMIGPQDMSSRMVMAGMMYAPSDKITLMMGTSFRKRSMDMLMMGQEMENSVKGMGDVQVSVLTPVFDTGESRLVAKLGVMVPVGEKAKTNHMGMRHGLMMQPGTGSWALRPALTYSNFHSNWSWGAQASANIKLDTNSYGEKAGDSGQLTAWASRSFNDYMSLSLRSSFESIEAAKTAMGEMGDLRERVRVFAGMNLIGRDGALNGHRIAFEVGATVKESRGTNALGTGASFMIGYQKSW